MRVLDLPAPALECVIEHMVLTVGLYKAVRLRHVCKAFDAEVRRAIFATNLFDFDKRAHVRGMTPAYMKLWLMAKIARPAANGRDALSSAVTRVTKLLLADTPNSGYEKRRLMYVENLCDAIAHHFYHNFSIFLDAMFEMGDSSSLAVDDLLSAAAAVGDLHKVQRLLLEESAFSGRSSLFGYASANSARKGDKAILTAIFETITQPDDKLSCMTLIAACRAGQQDIVEYLLSRPSQFHFLDRDFDDTFETAAAHGQTHILALLLPHLGTTRQSAVLSRSLRRASASGHTLAVQYLLDSGSDVDSWDPIGGALHLAAGRGFSQVVRVLLDRGADPTLRSRPDDPLFFAAKNGHTEVVQILLDHGANINAKGRDHSVLARAARNGELAMVKFLLDKGVDLMASGSGDRALEEAAGRGHEDIVRYLVEHGINVNGRGGARDPPILRAMVYGQQHIINLLVDLGAKKLDPSTTRYAAKFADGRLPA
ncbi:MAG: hypothetical protein Q9221_006522 [Calogaya cf. arnoldii]